MTTDRTVEDSLIPCILAAIVIAAVWLVLFVGLVRGIVAVDDDARPVADVSGVSQ